VTQQCVSVHR